MVLQFRLRQAAFLPVFRIRSRIEQQPRMPQAPVLVLRLLSQGLLSILRPALRVVDVLPDGITLDGDHLVVPIDRIAHRLMAGRPLQRAVQDMFGYLTLLEVHALPQRFVFTVRGGFPSPVEVIPSQR